jgi:hypothetical protein
VKKRAPFVGLRLALGAGIGVAVDNIPMGVGFGLILGLLIGV